MTAFPAARRTPARELRDGSYYKYPWGIEEVNLQAVVDSLHEIAMSWGADAIMNFQYESVGHRLFTGLPDEPSADQLMGVRVGGWVIRRQD